MSAIQEANSADTLIDSCPAKITAALAALLEAHDYARNVQRDRWDFAVEIRQMLDAGFSGSDLRWMVCKQLVQHGREVTPLGERRRQFRSTGELTFTRRTCFVLTDCGVDLARELLSREEPHQASVPMNGWPEFGGNGCLKLTAIQPAWDPSRHELTVGGLLVKQFRGPATNQETILMAFQEDGWPSRIDDPLPPTAQQEPKRRLHDTIKCLNRNQKHRLIHFHGDGTGKGVLWELVD